MDNQPLQRRVEREPIAPSPELGKSAAGPETLGSPEYPQTGPAVERREQIQTDRQVASEPMVALPSVSTAAVEKSPTAVAIEKVLEEDLGEIYFQMDPATQQKFKIEGEKTALKIESLLKTAKVKAREILKLIIAWLEVIPGASIFFVRQEAKRKADKIIRMHDVKK